MMKNYGAKLILTWSLEEKVMKTLLLAKISIPSVLELEIGTQCSP